MSHDCADSFGGLIKPMNENLKKTGFWMNELEVFRERQKKYKISHMLISSHDKLFAFININRFRLFFVESKVIFSRLAINNELSLEGC